MKRKYRFNVHAYAPEQNTFEVMTKSEYNNYLEIYETVKLPSNVTRNFTKDYKNNIRLVRDYYKSLHDGTKSLKKHCTINFIHSNERINKNASVKAGLYQNQADVLKVINDFKLVNQGYKRLISGLDENQNFTYETVYNKVSYVIKVKVK